MDDIEMEETEKRFEVKEAKDELKECINALKDRVDVLRERLKPVLKQQDDRKCCMGEKDNLVPLASDLDKMKVSVDVLRDNVDDIIESLEL